MTSCPSALWGVVTSRQETCRVVLERHKGWAAERMGACLPPVIYCAIKSKAGCLTECCEGFHTSQLCVCDGADAPPSPGAAD